MDSLDRLTDQVVASFAGAPDPRLGALLGDLVRRLHGFVRDNDVTVAMGDSVEVTFRIAPLLAPEGV